MSVMSHPNLRRVAMRSVLINSERWCNLIKKCDLLKIGRAGPIDMSSWSRMDYVDVYEWAKGIGDEKKLPRVLVVYIEKVK